MLVQFVRRQRASLEMSQSKLAKRFHSSQSRIAKLEAADPSVSIDLQLRALFVLGATRRDIGRLLGKKAGTPAA